MCGNGNKCVPEGAFWTRISLALWQRPFSAHLSLMPLACRNKPSKPNLCCAHSASEIIGQYRNECTAPAGTKLSNEKNLFRRGCSYESLTFQSPNSRGNLSVTGFFHHGKGRASPPNASADLFTDEGPIVPNFTATNRAQARCTITYERLISRCNCSGWFHATSPTWAYIFLNP